jgi:excisionase family DNA binding protein
VTVVEDGGQTRREVIVGIVAMYAPLLLTPEEAPAYAGVEARTFYEAVQEGAVPFLRVESDVLFYRPWVDRWVEGRGRRASGRSMSYRSARKKAFGWADRLRSRSLDKAARGPLPFRMEAIPEEQLEEMVDRRRRFRGRVFRDDLSEWLGHFDQDLETGDLETVWAMTGAGQVAKLRGSWAEASADTRIAAAPREPARAPAPRTADGASASLDELGLGGARGWETAGGDDRPTMADGAGAGDEEDGEEFDLDEFGDAAQTVPIGTGSWDAYGGPGSGGGPARLVRLDILDVYVGSCRPGAALDAAVEFVLDGLAEGEVADLTVEWDFYVDGRNVKRDSTTIAREAGPQEIELAVTCPDLYGAGELQVLLLWPERDLEAEGSTDVTVRGAARRTWASLSMPAPRRCLTALIGDDAAQDYGIQMAQGLDSEQISAAVHRFQEQTLRCHPDDGAVTGQVMLEISVACNGRVKEATVLDDDTGDPEFAQCVADTMTFCPFDPHARDEVIFQQSLRYE